MQRIAFTLVVLIVAALFAACSNAGTNPFLATTTSSPGNTSPAATTAGLTATEIPATSRPLTPTPTAVSTLVPAPPRNSLTLWHSYPPGSPEEQTLTRLIDEAQETMPTLAIQVVALPGDRIASIFENAAAAGGGPDLILASTDHLLREARAGLIKALDAELAPHRSTYASNALDTMNVDGKLYGIPLSLSTTALYYNAAKFPNPPKTTGALLDAVKGGTKLVLIRSVFHNFGLFGAFGGKLIDENGRCVADAGGFAEGMQYLRELKAAGAEFVTSGAEGEARFKEGQAALTINGSWLRADFHASLGDQLGVAPLPAGPTGPATPLLDSTGFLINANTERLNDAAALAIFLTKPESQQRFVEHARIIPSSAAVAIADDEVGGLAAAALTGVPRPQRPELEAFWQPLDQALAEVLDANADPAAAVQSACAAINQANGK